MNRNLPQLTAGPRYVFFSSLEREASPLYQSIASQAKDMLYDLKDDIQHNAQNASNTNKMDNALKFLQKAAQFERAKENQFFANFKSQYPNAEQVFNINLTNPTNEDYIDFIININSALKGAKAFKNRLSTEYKRLQRRKQFTGENYDVLTQDPEDLKRRVAQANEDKLTFFKRGGTSGAKSGSGEGGESNFTDIFYRRSNMSKITSMIIQTYGVQLFQYSKNHLDLSPRNTAALIKALTDEAYAILLSDKGIFADTTDSETDLRNTILGKDFESFVKDLLEAPDLPYALKDIADQYNLGTVSNPEIEVSDQIKNLKQDLIANAKSIFKNMPETTTPQQWLKQIGISNNFLKDMYRSTLTVSAQAFYTGEDLVLIEQIRNRIAAALGGGKNPTDDVYGGKLITKINVNYDASKLETSLYNAGRDAYKDIDGLKDLDTFFTNAEKLRLARDMQQAELDKAIEEVKNLENAGEFLLSHINVHTTIKGYTSAGTSGFKNKGGFEGASFGSNLTMQLNVLEQMTNSGGISLGDLQFLQFACINAGEQMIGHFLKPTLEDYFSVFVGFLMFNDAELMFEDIANWDINTQISGVNDIHLYELNGITFPSSYILENTYQSLMAIYTDLMPSNKKGVKAKLNTYNKGPINHNWEETRKQAIKSTHLEIRFLAGFLDILDEINQAMPN